MQWSDDFTHLVRLNRFAVMGSRSGTKGNWALEFIDTGITTRTYALDDLVKSLGSTKFLPYETWDWYHQWNEDFEKKGAELHITTAPRSIWFFRHEFDLGYQEHYRFDFATGKIITSSIDNRDYLTKVKYLSIAAGFSVALTALFLVWGIRRIRRKNIA